MSKVQKSFNSKVLLFGEYSVIKDSMALSIPYSLFDGRLSFKNNKKKVIDPELKSFLQYIKSLSDSGELLCSFDIASFEFDISQGLYFNSTIPQGFGVGSSGALCAALFGRYAEKENVSQENIQGLRDILAQLESYFHGKSSGLDPLISYLNGPLLIKEKNDLGLVNVPSYKEGKGGLFLLNTGRERRTEPLVNLFLEKCKTNSFGALVKESLLPITNLCITSFLEGDLERLKSSFNELSEFQYDHFSPMIPKLFQGPWLEGLNSGVYNLKLCGAGGGGFLLGITEDLNAARKALGSHEIRPICYFF